MGHSMHLFIHFRLSSIVEGIKDLPMTGFEPQTFNDRSDRSTN